MNFPKTINILLVDDHSIVLQGLKSLIDNEPNMQVIAEAKDGREAVQMATRLRPDVVIIDISMPNMNGIVATKQITSSLPKTKVVALSIHSDKRYVKRMFEHKASGYVLKDCTFDEIIKAIHTVLDNKIYLCSQLSDIAVDVFNSQVSNPPCAPEHSLTIREREILQLVAEGYASKTMAKHLFISIKTVETHRAHIMKKLGIHSIAQLTKYAVREGLTSL